jgi:outer membrane protein assembly factor BamB
MAPSTITLTGYPVSTAIDSTAVYVLQTGQNGSGAVVQRIDRATNRITMTSAASALPGDASQVVRGSRDDLWVLTRQGPNEPASASGLWLLNARTLATERQISQGTYFYGFTLAGNHLWAGAPYALYEFDATTGTQLATLQYPNIAVTPTYSAAAGVIDVRDVGGAGDNFATALYALDPTAGTRLASREIHVLQGEGVGRLVSYGDSVYFLQIGGDGTGTPHRLNARTLQDEQVGLFSAGSDVAAAHYTDIYIANDALLLYSQSTGVTVCTSASAPAAPVSVPSSITRSTIAAVAADATGTYLATGDGQVIPAGNLAGCTS